MSEYTCNQCGLKVLSHTEMIERLHPKPGDVLVARGFSPKGADVLFEHLELMKGLKDLLVIVLEEGETLELLNEDEMRASGWVKA